MSKLAKEILAVQTGNRAIRQKPMEMVTARDSYGPVVTSGYYTEYNFQVLFGTKIYISEEAMVASNSDVIQNITTNVRSQVVEEIFGEFKQRLFKLQNNAYATGDLESAKIVASILADMFEV